MGYTARTRDRYQVLAALTTGAFAVGSLAAAGALTGAAARQTALRDQARRQDEASQQRLAQAVAGRTDPRLPVPATLVVRRTRPARTIVHTRVLHLASAPGVARVGGGGTVSAAPAYAPPAAPAAPAAAAPSRVVHSAPVPAPPPPAPRPAPAPSSGS